VKFLTIWTLRAMTMRERLNQTGEWAVMILAHRLPRKLAYWSFIDTGVRYMDKDDTVPDVHFMTLVKRAGDDILEDHP
jgi:hypothetical protein